MAYPGAYREGMSSLGYLQVLRLIEERQDWAVQRSFWEKSRLTTTRETGRNPLDFPIVAISVAYELQLVTVARIIDSLGQPILASERPLDGRLWDRPTPLVIAGGPLTQVNPRLLGAFADLVVVGESEDLVDDLLASMEDNPRIEELLSDMALRPGFYVPRIHGNDPPAPIRANLDRLPAWAPIRSTGAEFRDMFLIEVGRGCAGNCTFCSMRRDLSGGARFVTAQSIVERIPSDAKRVGLVGAEVSRHPAIREIIGFLLTENMQVGLSSLRADAADEEMFRLLSEAGMQSPTIAADGASERLRRMVRKGVRSEHLLRAARAAGNLGIRWLKVYQILGLPTETDEDIEEMADVTREMARHQAIHLAVSFLVPKPKTPLQDHIPLDPREAKRRIALLRNRLGGKVRLTTARIKETHLEWLLAFGRLETGRILAQVATSRGGPSALLRALQRSERIKETHGRPTET